MIFSVDIDYVKDIEEAWASHDSAACEQRFVNRMAALEQAGQTETPAYIAYANELGTLYRVTARYDAGEKAFKAALAGIDALEGHSQHFAVCLDNLAELYRLAGQLDACDEALAQAESLFVDRESAEYAACLNYKGHAALARGNFEQAVSLYQDALHITEQLQPQSITLATAYQNTANAFLQTGQTDTANQFLHKALDVYETGALPVNAHYVGLLNSLASTAVSGGDNQAAAQYFERAVEALDRCNVSPLDAIIVMANAGTVFCKVDRSKQACALVPRMQELVDKGNLNHNEQALRALAAAKTWGQHDA